jgi:hypothetical protein
MVLSATDWAVVKRSIVETKAALAAELSDMATTAAAIRVFFIRILRCG